MFECMETDQTAFGGGPTHLMNINDESVFIVRDDLTGAARIFIWLKPLSQSADETTNVFMALLRCVNNAGGS